MSARNLETRAVTYHLEIPIDAPRARVWEALTAELDAWWLPDFHMVSPDSTLNLDARAGGQLIEQRADGGSLLWYTVTLCVPGEALHLVGHSSPAWGGPHSSILVLTLAERDGGTLLRVDDSFFGHVGADHARASEDGWRQLLGDGLKRHVERGGD